MAIKTSGKQTELPSYTTPMVVPIGRGSYAVGVACNPGSAATGSSCSIGNVAGNCHGGSSADIGEQQLLFQEAPVFKP